MQIMVIQCGIRGRSWLTSNLTRQGFVPLMARSMDHAFRGALVNRAVAIVIEIAQVCDHCAALVRQLRERDRNLPVMILSNHSTWNDRVAAFDFGADDFITMPARPEEVAARLRAIIRRGQGDAKGTISAGPIKIDLKSRMAWVDGAELPLTRNEFRLLRLFMFNPQRVLTHDEICDQLYIDGKPRSPNAIEVNIARIRRKIGHDRIRTIRGLGYRFSARPGEACGIPANGEVSADAPVVSQ